MAKSSDIRPGEEGLRGEDKEIVSTLYLFEGEIRFDDMFNSSPISSSED